MPRGMLKLSLGLRQELEIWRKQTLGASFKKEQCRSFLERKRIKSRSQVPAEKTRNIKPSAREKCKGIRMRET
jgi:hypothetical protein